MKKNFLTLSIIASVFSYAQNQNAIKGRMGINTTTPKATLHIVAENNDNNPGVIVPNITLPTTDQFKKLEKVVDGKTKDFAESTLIYVKGENFDNKRIDINPASKTEEVSQKGFYYYDGKDWLPLRPKIQMYLPSIVLETELPPKTGTYTSEEADNKVYCVNLYNVYQGQFKNITNGTNGEGTTATSSKDRLNDECSSDSVAATKTISIKDKTYKASTESRKLEVIEGGGNIDYYVTYYDPDIFKDVKIDGRTLQYKIIRNQTDPTKTKNNITEKTFISILLREK
jgi:hypothetical protein